MGVFALMVFGAGLEVLGVSAILPFLSIAARPQMIHDVSALRAVYDTLGFASYTEFLLFTGALVIVIIVLSNATKAGVHFATVRFTRTCRYEISTGMLNHILQQPYAFFLGVHPVDLFKNVIEEVNNTVNGVLMPFLSGLSKALIVVGIILFLFVANPLLAVGIAGFLGGSYFLVFRLVKRTLARLGKRRLEATRLRQRALAEVLYGIKDVRVLGREAFFSRRFATASQDLIDGDAKNDLIGHLPRYFLETIAFASVVGLIVFFITTRGDFQEAIPLIGVYTFAGYRLMPQFQQLFAAVAKVRYNLPAVDALLRSMERFHLREALVPFRNQTTAK